MQMLVTRRALRCAIVNTHDACGQRRIRHTRSESEAAVTATTETRAGRAPRTRPRARGALVSLGVAIVLVSAAGCASWRAAGLYQRGAEALERGDSERAVGLLEEAARLAPEASEVRDHLGLAQLAVGRDDLALASFELATQLDCDNTAARGNLARLQGHLLREAAIASVSSPRAANPRDPGNVAGGLNGEVP